MESKYNPLVSEMNEKIRKIKDEAMRQIAEEQYRVLEQTKRDFALIGWGKYWRERDLHADGQIERLMESVSDIELKLGEYNKKNGSGVVDGKAKYWVSGSGCSCPDFIVRGLPCKHMYFLAGILARLAGGEELTIDDLVETPPSV